MRLELADWRGLLRPGDVLVALGGAGFQVDAKTGLLERLREAA